MIKLVFALLLALAFCSQAFGTRAVDRHLGQNDIKRLQKVFVDGLASNDLQSIYYSSLNIEPTSAAEKQAICGKLGKLHEESKINDFEKDLYYVGAHKNLRCSDKIPEPLVSKIKVAFQSDSTSSQEIYYRVLTQKLLGVQVDEAALKKIVKVLQELLKKEDSLANLGYVFNIASDLNVPTLAFVADRVEDAFAQADEVDGKMLQFEGGLSITALVVNGAFKTIKAYNKPTPLNAVQAVKFSTYFLSRRSVQTAKGAHLLIESLKTLINASKISPICIQPIGSAQLEPESPILNIALVDLLGKALSPVPQNVVGKIVLKGDNKVIAEKVPFASKSSDKTVFTADLSSYKLARGIYTVDVSVDNVYSLSLQFKILGRVKVSSVEIGVAESDATSVVKKQTLNFPNTVSETLQADSTQKVILKAALLDERTEKPINVHQCFLRFVSKKTDKEAIFVAEQDSSQLYKIDVDLSARASHFAHQSGAYELYLIIGDAALSNSFQWHLANIELKFSPDSKETKKPHIRSALPEIEHLFRVPEPRPPRIVSDIFTGLCLTPLVLLFLFWGKLGINVSNFTFAPSTICFHLGFGGILTLFGIFWLKLNMFQTLRLLVPLAVFTFISGNRLLRRQYAQRISKSGGASSSS